MYGVNTRQSRSGKARASTGAHGRTEESRKLNRPRHLRFHSDTVWDCGKAYESHRDQIEIFSLPMCAGTNPDERLNHHVKVSTLGKGPRLEASPVIQWLSGLLAPPVISVAVKARRPDSKSYRSRSPARESACRRKT